MTPIKGEQPAGIGDLESTKVGTAARFNAGKPPLYLIPPAAMALLLRAPTEASVARGDWNAAMEYLNDWYVAREDWTICLPHAFDAFGCTLEDTAAVFDFGRRKYAAWNWLKGMPWSQPVASLLRHVNQMQAYGETHDSDSGLPHTGHIGCNLVMLMTYEMTYPAGDDRPQLPEA